MMQVDSSASEDAFSGNPGEWLTFRKCGAWSFNGAIYITCSGCCRSIVLKSPRMMLSRIIFAVHPFLDIW